MCPQFSLVVFNLQGTELLSKLPYSLTQKGGQVIIHCIRNMYTIPQFSQCCPINAMTKDQVLITVAIKYAGNSVVYGPFTTTKVAARHSVANVSFNNHLNPALFEEQLETSYDIRKRAVGQREPHHRLQQKIHRLKHRFFVQNPIDQRQANYLPHKQHIQFTQSALESSDPL